MDNVNSENVGASQPGHPGAGATPEWPAQEMAPVESGGADAPSAPGDTGPTPPSETAPTEPIQPAQRPPMAAHEYPVAQQVQPHYGYESSHAYYPDTTPVAAQHDATQRRSGVGAALAVAVIAALVIGTLAGAVAGFAGARLASGRAILTPAKITVIPSKTEEPVVAASAAAVPSVVNIDVSGGTTSSSPDPNLPQNHPNVPVQGNGSGVAYKAAPGGGTYIITNNHVVEGADTITVRDASGAAHKAKLIGRDPDTDIGVVEITDSIPAIQMGNSGALQVGQLVVAIGSPFGLEHSVTSGVVSALSRSLPDSAGNTSGTYPLVNVIQTDAAINPGNSGGALVDRNGRLVGINTAIYSESGSSGGIGFAIPSATAKNVADSLISGGQVEHPFLGVVGQTVDGQLAKDKKLTVTEGAYVTELTPNTNAVKAGIKPGDVIVSIDSTPIRSMDDLILAVRKQAVGNTVKVGLIRDGKKITLSMKVGTKPANLDTSQPTTATP